MDDFERLSGYISDALAHTGLTHLPPTSLDAVRDAVDRGQLTLWPGQRAVLLTQHHPLVLEIYLAAGDMQEIEVLHDRACAAAKANGARHAVFSGRRGWERTWITRAGWTATQTVFERTL